MIVAITPKFVAIGVVAVVPAAGAGIAYAVISKQEPPMLMLVSAPADTDNQPTDEIAFSDNQNYQCKVDKTVDPYCLLQSVTFDDANKKWSNLVHLNAATRATEAISKSSLKSADKFYLIKGSRQLVKAVDWNTGTNKLLIQSTKDGETDKSYVAFTPLMAFNKTKGVAKNNLFLVKAHELFESASSTPETTTIGSSNTEYKCVLSEADIADTQKHKDCTIKQFAATQTSASETADYSSLTYAKGSNSPTTITKHNFYLVEFTKPLTKEEVKDSSIFYLAKSTQSEPSTWSKKVTFKKSHQAVEAGSTSNERLILID